MPITFVFISQFLAFELIIRSSYYQVSLIMMYQEIYNIDFFIIIETQSLQTYTSKIIFHSYPI